MRKTLFFSVALILFALWNACAGAQELVVFNNDTAMTVKAHSEKDGYIFLTLQEGQMAVPKDRVKEIKKINAATHSPVLRDTSGVSRVSSDTGNLKTPAQEGKRAGMRPSMTRPAEESLGRPSSTEDEAEDDEGDDGDDAEDDGDDEDDGDSATPQEPVKPGGLRPMQLPSKATRPAASAPVLRKR